MKNVDQEIASEFSANLNSSHFTSVNTVSSQAVNGTTQRIYNKNQASPDQTSFERFKQIAKEKLIDHMSTWAHHSGLKSNALFSAISSENESMKFVVESFGKDFSQIIYSKLESRS